MAVGDEEPPERPPVPDALGQGACTGTQAAPLINGTSRNSGCTDIREVGFGEHGQDLTRPAGTFLSLLIGPLILRLARCITPILDRAPLAPLSRGGMHLKS